MITTIFAVGTIFVVAAALLRIGRNEATRRREEASSRHRHPTSRKLKLL
jgi:hypothetical protein